MKPAPKPATLTDVDVGAQFVRLADLGVEMPRRYDDERILTRTIAGYTVELAEAGITADDLAAAVRVYLRRPLDHGGRRPWPDVGMLLDAVAETRTNAIPVWDVVAPFVPGVLSAHFAHPELGWRLDAVPAAAREALARALVASRAAHRGGEELRFLMRDIEAAYNRMREGR